MAAVEREDAWGLGQAPVPSPREVAERHPRVLPGKKKVRRMEG